MTDVMPDDAGELVLATENSWVLVVAEDSLRTPLALALENGGYTAVPLSPDEDIGAFLAALPRAPDLLLISLDCSRRAALASVRSARVSPRGRLMPILGVTAFDRMGFDLQMLRAHGVVGLVDRRATPSMVLERVERILRPKGAGRRAERARCLFPLWVRSRSGTTEEFALDMSVTGIRLTATETTSTNTDLELRFRLPLIADDTIVAIARVVHQSRHRNSWARFEVGAVFYPMEDRHTEVIECEVERLLSAA